jgi:pyruvate/2-oxoglutarate dehydrogenase complex dihydrolipoamide acyltransferase (E2) component
MIQITFTPETPQQAAVIAEAIGKYLDVVPVGGTVAEVKEPAAETPKKTRKAAAPAAPETPSASSTAAETPASTATPASPSEVTLEVVRDKLAKLSQAGKGPEVKNLIGKFGATKLTDIPSEKYVELLAAAEEL